MTSDVTSGTNVLGRDAEIVLHHRRVWYATSDGGSLDATHKLKHVDAFT